MNLKQKYREHIQNTGVHMKYKTWLENQIVQLMQILSSAVKYEEDARRLMEHVGHDTGLGDTSIKKVTWLLWQKNYLKSWRIKNDRKRKND